MIPERHKPFSHVRGEGKGEVPLRFAFEEAAYRISTRQIPTELHTDDGLEIIAQPDFCVFHRNHYPVPVFDDGSIHCKPKQIDYDLFIAEALHALGYKVFRFKHAKPLTITKARHAVALFRKIMGEALKPEYIDLEAK